MSDWHPGPAASTPRSRRAGQWSPPGVPPGLRRQFQPAVHIPRWRPPRSPGSAPGAGPGKPIRTPPRSNLRASAARVPTTLCDRHQARGAHGLSRSECSREPSV